MAAPKGVAEGAPEGVAAVLAPVAGTEPFRGVNLGGWLLLEDWMWTYQMKQKGIVSEWGLIRRHGGPRDRRAISLLRAHWETFVTEGDLDRLKDFGFTHVRVPIGWWLVDYDAADGFVDGGERYLFRLLGWLKQRGMRALLDLHALPGAQAAWQSFTGKQSPRAAFFLDRSCYGRGKRAMRQLAELILTYDGNLLTSGVVMGMELVNEPDWRFWDTSPGIRELYETMVPELRRILPAHRFAIFLSFQEEPGVKGARWLASMRERDPASFAGVVYDAHVYHSYGDDNSAGRGWSPDVDSCKTCCRDPIFFAPWVEAGLDVVIGEFSLNNGFYVSDDLMVSYMRNQLSLWAHVPGVLGSFFWNHRILPAPGQWYREMSLLDLFVPHGPLPPVSAMRLDVVCPGEDLSRCPVFELQTLKWNDDCRWVGARSA